MRILIAKHTLAMRYMNAVIASTATRAPKDEAMRESTNSEPHNRNNIAPNQMTVTGHAIRIVRVTMVAKPSRDVSAVGLPDGQPTRRSLGVVADPEP